MSAPGTSVGSTATVDPGLYANTDAAAIAGLVARVEAAATSAAGAARLDSPAFTGTPTTPDPTSATGVANLGTVQGRALVAALIFGGN